MQRNGKWIGTSEKFLLLLQSPAMLATSTPLHGSIAFIAAQTLTCAVTVSVTHESRKKRDETITASPLQVDIQELKILLWFSVSYPLLSAPSSSFGALHIGNPLSLSFSCESSVEQTTKNECSLAPMRMIPKQPFLTYSANFNNYSSILPLLPVRIVRKSERACILW